MATLKHVSGYRFSKRISFGKIKSITGNDGVSRPSFEIEMTVWGAPYNLEQSLKYKAKGNTLKDLKQIAIRPNKDVTYECGARYDGVDYRIIDIQHHLVNKNTSYDLLTLESGIK